jgi:hypothetical protein
MLPTLRLALMAAAVPLAALAVAAPVPATSTVAAAQGCATWTQVSAHDPGSFSELSGLAVVSPTDVWAIGGGGFQHDAGAGFTLVAAPSLGTLRGGPRAMSGDASNDVWAVGQTAPPRSYPPTSTLVERFNGSSWAIVPSPSPDPQSNTLNAVAALAPNNVWAVGETASRALVEHFDGSSWSVVGVPAPGTGSDLYAVAADGPASVKAVGYTIGAGGVLHPLVLSFNGSAWSVDATPAGATLTEVTGVPGTTHFFAAGTSTAQSVLFFDGTTWTSRAGAGTPFKGDSMEDGSIYGIDALSDTNVWVVGSYYGSQAQLYMLQPFALRYDGTAWTSAFSTFSAFSGASSLLSVSHAGTALFTVGYDSPTDTSYGEVFAATRSC